VSVQPSGLLFLVIIAIWAAYLLQHWIRRREHLVAARSIDRFSDAMRVLERRTPLAEPGTTAAAPRSYAVSPARPSRAEVVVQHSQPSAPERTAAPVQAAGAPSLVGGMSARRLRGLSLLASLTLLVVVTPLTVFGVLAGWTALLAVAVLALDLAWLRRAAQVERARRRTATRVARREPSLTTHARRSPTVAPGSTHAAREPKTVAAPAAATEGGTPESGQTPDADPAPAAPVDTVTGSGWQPVPVPPPTYTLKAKAERPVPVAAPVPESASAVEEPGSVAVMDDLLDRRRAAGA
jgi:hypothetical protein